MSETDYIELARVNRPHGIKGGLSVVLHNKESKTLQKGSVVFSRGVDDQNFVKWTVDRAQYGNKLIVYLEGMNDRTELEKLLPFDLFIPREHFEDLSSDEFYLVDLINAKVYDFESHQEIGVIENFSDNGMQTIFNMKIDGKELLLPYTDYFIPEIDVKNKKVFIRLPEYC
ncbi:MAG: 16S rRNA processing protein RimM [Bacteriovoracaceae bacterium]|jgi:16S rRNA processing protein RimM|nr:16S rRNA processing protein RimM [Bacteriovoracaceae bacterium]